MVCLIAEAHRHLNVKKARDVTLGTEKLKNTPVFLKAGTITFRREHLTKSSLFRGCKLKLKILQAQSY